MTSAGFIAFDEFKFVTEHWVDVNDFSSVIPSVILTGSTWVLISEQEVFAKPLSTPLSSVP